jgi:DNA-binding response OmpR family regulator
VIHVGALQLDTANMTVQLDGKPVEVTAYEFSILRALAQRPGKVLSREQLLDLAKGSADLSFDRSIDVHVSRLRAKLGDDSRNPKILKTVRGAGYMLAAGDS